jgi:hypothetical protein
MIRLGTTAIATWTPSQPMACMQPRFLHQLFLVGLPAKRHAAKHELDDQSDQPYWVYPNVQNKTHVHDILGAHQSQSHSSIMLEHFPRSLPTHVVEGDATIKSLESCNILQILRYSKGLDIP